MATLKKYKSMANLPQPSGLNIKVNKDTQPFNAPIELYGQRMEHDNQLALDDLDNKIELAKLQNKDQKTFLKEQETMFKERNKTLFDNTLLSEKIKLIEFDSFLKKKHWNNPSLYKAKFDEYIKVKTQSGLFPDPTRLLKFQEKASSLGIASMDEISKNVATSLENESWELLNLAKEKISTNIQERIFSMDSLSDLADQNVLYAQESINLESNLKNYAVSHQQVSDKTEADLHNILDSWRFDHDKAFIEHFLTNIIMQPDEPNSVFMAEAIWEAWKSGTKLEAIDKNLMATGDYYKKGTPDFWLDLLNRYTYDQHPLDNKEKIMTMVDAAIENKKDEWTNIRNQRDTEVIAEKDILWDQYMDINNVNSIKNINTQEVNQVIAEGISVKKGSDGEIVEDKEKLKLFNLTQDTNLRLKQIVNEFRIDGSISNAISKMQKYKLDLTLLDYPENYSKEKILYERLFTQDNAGINFNTSEIFNELSLAYKTNVPQHPSLQPLISSIKNLRYFPQQMVDNIYIYTGLNFDNDEDIDTLLSMAIVKINTIGKGKVGNLNIGGKDVAEALDAVFTINKSDGRIAAINKWKSMMNPDNTSQKIRKEKIDAFVLKKESTKIKGFLFNTIEEDFEDIYMKAVAREMWISIPFWWTWGENRLRQMFGMKEATEIKGKRSLHNIIKHKNTFILGARKNMSMEKGAYKEFRTIFDKIAHNFVNSDTPSEPDLEHAYWKAKIAAINQMTDADYSWSSMLYQHDQTAGLVLTKNSPEDITGMDGPELSTNVTAFAYNHIKNMDLNDQFLTVLGVPQQDGDMDEFNRFMGNFFKLDENRDIRLVPDTTTLDRENMQFHIMLRSEDGDWKTLMDGAEPVSWKPNTVFSDTGTNYSRSSIMHDAIIDEVNNIDLSMGKSEVPVRIEDPELKLEFLEIFKKMHQANEKFTEVGDWLQETFPNFPFIGHGKGADADIDTINEKLTNLADNFEFKINEKQQELNIEFKSEIEQLVLTHKITYDNDIPSELSPEAKFGWLRDKNEINMNKYNELYGNIGVVVHPRHQFIITDIIDAIGIKDIKLTDSNEIESIEYSDNLQHISEGSKFYESLKNEQYRDVGEALENLSKFFKSDQRFQALMMHYGIRGNTIQ